MASGPFGVLVPVAPMGLSTDNTPFSSWHEELEAAAQNASQAEQPAVAFGSSNAPVAPMNPLATRRAANNPSAQLASGLGQLPASNLVSWQQPLPPLPPILVPNFTIPSTQPPASALFPGPVPILAQTVPPPQTQERLHDPLASHIKAQASDPLSPDIYHRTFCYNVCQHPRPHNLPPGEWGHFAWDSVICAFMPSGGGPEPFVVAEDLTTSQAIAAAGQGYAVWDIQNNPLIVPAMPRVIQQYNREAMANGGRPAMQWRTVEVRTRQALLMGIKDGVTIQMREVPVRIAVQNADRKGRMERAFGKRKGWEEWDGWVEWENCGEYGGYQDGDGNEHRTAVDVDIRELGEAEMKEHGHFDEDVGMQDWGWPCGCYLGLGKRFELWSSGEAGSSIPSAPG
jgi:hypothetical protein